MQIKLVRAAADLGGPELTHAGWPYLPNSSFPRAEPDHGVGLADNAAADHEPGKMIVTLVSASGVLKLQQLVTNDGNWHVFERGNEGFRWVSPPGYFPFIPHIGADAGALELPSG